MRPPRQYGQWPHFENSNLYSPLKFNLVYRPMNYAKIRIIVKTAVAVSFIYLCHLVVIKLLNGLRK